MLTYKNTYIDFKWLYLSLILVIHHIIILINLSLILLSFFHILQDPEFFIDLPNHSFHFIRFKNLLSLLQVRLRVVELIFHQIQRSNDLLRLRHLKAIISIYFPFIFLVKNWMVRNGKDGGWNTSVYKSSARASSFLFCFSKAKEIILWILIVFLFC